MTSGYSPQRWASELTKLLNTVLGKDRFPVNVTEVAKEFSHQRFPEDPVTLVEGGDLPGFEGALYPAPADKKGWGIIYNNAVTSPGRINFTLAHEFGHYLLHRNDHPRGFECGVQDMVRWDSEYGQIEAQANEFAAALLMPFDDFRRQIDNQAKPTFKDIGLCAERYGVSLTAATSRWLRYTSRRAVMVVSRDGYILWARSSEPAFKSGVYFKTANQEPIPVPSGSLAARRDIVLVDKNDSIQIDAGVWFKEPCVETALVADKYDFTISLLHLGEDPRTSGFDEDMEEEKEDDTYERMTSRTPSSSWLG